eukprot:PhM_4_TR7466/c2_g1_i1/m.30020
MSGLSFTRTGIKQMCFVDIDHFPKLFKFADERFLTNVPLIPSGAFVLGVCTTNVMIHFVASSISFISLMMKHGVELEVIADDDPEVSRGGDVAERVLLDRVLAVHQKLDRRIPFTILCTGTELDKLRASENWAELTASRDVQHIPPRRHQWTDDLSRRVNSVTCPDSDEDDDDDDDDDSDDDRPVVHFPDAFRVATPHDTAQSEGSGARAPRVCPTSSSSYYDGNVARVLTVTQTQSASSTNDWVAF